MSSIRKLFWISLVIKLVLAAALPLTNDESYYWVWSRHMQLSYFDHPPVVAWLYWLGDFVKFSGGSVRWAGVLLSQAGLAIWLVALRRFLDDRQRFIWLSLALLSPLVGGAGIILTPDLPLMFFYGLAFWLFLRWRDQATWQSGLAFGVAMGLGFTSKYMMVLFPLSFLPLLMFDRPLRGLVLRSLHLFVVGGLLGTLPVWLWNLLNDFASFHFQAQHGLGNEVWKPSWTYEYVLVQIGFIFPTVLYWALAARKRMPAVLHCMAWVPIVFFFLTTARGYAEGNWPIAAYPAIFALAVSAYPRNARSLRITLAIWGTVLACLAAVIIIQPSWSRQMKFKEFHQFDNVIRVLREKPLEPVFARSYQMASKLHFELGRPIYKVRGMTRADFYDGLKESAPNQPLIYVVVEKTDALPPEFSNYVKTETIPVDEVFEIWRMESK